MRPGLPAADRRCCRTQQKARRHRRRHLALPQRRGAIPGAARILHDDRPDARPGPRARPGAGRAHPWRDERDQGPGRLQGDAAAILRPHPRRQAILLSQHAGREADATSTRSKKAQAQVAGRSCRAISAGCPRPPLLIKPVEPFREKSAGKAFYNDPPPDGSRPGIYYVNLYDMNEHALDRGRGAVLPRGHSRPPSAGRAAVRARPRAKCRRSASSAATPRPTKAGASTPRNCARRWASTRTPTATSAGSSSSCTARSGWWSTAASTTSAGAASRRSNMSRTIAPTPRAGSSRRSSATSSIPGQATAYMVGKLKIEELRARAKAELGAKYRRSRLPRHRAAGRIDAARHAGEAGRRVDCAGEGS